MFGSVKLDSVNLDPVNSAGTRLPVPATPKLGAVARDFEALLLTQMLRTMRETSSHGFGSGEDQSMDAAMGLAEDQLGRALVAGGGLGLSKLVEAGLKQKP